MFETVIRGRFAPPTNEAIATIRDALASGSVQVVVTCAELARSSRLPWTVSERVEMLRLALGEDVDRIRFSEADGQDGETIGHDEDAVAAFLRGEDIAVAPAIAGWLDTFRQNRAFTDMAAEARYVEDYRRAWDVAPYPVTLVTVDTVIVHDDPSGVPHVLLVRRGGIPGKGQYAVPGGFIEPDETLPTAALRELREETGLDLSDEDARSRLKGRHVFDDPQRSSRGRIITHAFYFMFPAGRLPDVDGRDDAMEAHWVPLTDLARYRGQFFEDHGHILAHFIKL